MSHAHVTHEQLLRAHLHASSAQGHRALVRVIGVQEEAYQALTWALSVISSVSSKGRDPLSVLSVSVLSARVAWRERGARVFEALKEAQRFEVSHCMWSEARTELGRTLDVLIIDLFEGLNPDALGATLGAVRGGGCVLLLMPPTPPQQGALQAQLEVWPHERERQSAHFWGLWWRSTLSAEGITLNPQALLQEEAEAEALHTSNAREPLEPSLEPSLEPPLKGGTRDNPQDTEQVHWSAEEALSLIAPLCVNDEQRAVVRDVLASQKRQGFTAVSVTARRGRGKSYALGLAAAALNLMGERALYLTAPSERAVEGVFEAMNAALSVAGAHPEREGLTLTSREGRLTFVTPSALWAREVPFKTLLVDEAAALPVPLLTLLLEGKPKLVFSTTTFGYEGAGRGFSLRFRPHLQRKLKKLYERRLSAPIRWAEGDPVERWTMESLLLEAPTELRRVEVELERCCYVRLEREALAHSPELLRAVVGLLVTAHYRTQPSDVWRLLDAPNLSTHALMYPATPSSLASQELLAVALISEEGGLPPEMAAEVYEGRSRPRGQLFAANFAVHLNCEEAATLKMARVVRIATRPTQQGGGLGALLLAHIEVWAKERRVELFGSSFGVTAQLSRFWLRAGFEPLRVSVRQSHMSGERSALVCKALTSKASALLRSLRPELARDFESQLQGPLRLLDLEVCAQALAVSAPLSDPLHQLSRRDWLALAASAYAGRAYELCERGAHALTCCALSAQPLVPPERALSEGLLRAQAEMLGVSERAWRCYLHKSAQRWRWLELTHALELDGPTVAMKEVSEVLRALLSRYAPAWLLEEARRFPRHPEPLSIEVCKGEGRAALSLITLSLITLSALLLCVGCGAPPRPALTLKVEGVASPRLVSYCVSEREPERPLLWVSDLKGLSAISLKVGELRPVARRSIVWASTSTQARFADAERALFEHEAGCSEPFKPLPSQGALAWRRPAPSPLLEEREERLEVSAWGWRGPTGGRQTPRALEVVALDRRYQLLYLGGSGGLYAWPLKSKRAPRRLPLPVGFTRPVSALLLDGEGLWVRDASGRAWALKRAPLHPQDPLTPPRAVVTRGPTPLPPLPAARALKLGDALLSAQMGSVSARWGAQTLTLPPLRDAAQLSPTLAALATEVGVELWRAPEAHEEGGLRRVASLELGAPVTALVSHEDILYALSPRRGLLWLSVQPLVKQGSQAQQAQSPQN